MSIIYLTYISIIYVSIKAVLKLFIYHLLISIFFKFFSKNDNEISNLLKTCFLGGYNKFNYKQKSRLKCSNKFLLYGVHFKSFCRYPSTFVCPKLTSTTRVLLFSHPSTISDHHFLGRLRILFNESFHSNTGLAMSPFSRIM